VVVASVYAFANGMGTAPYAMAKAGVEQLGRALRVELLPHGASASVAYFGFIDTPMVHQALDQDPMAGRLMELAPKFLHKRLHPRVAGEAIVSGIEGRKPRIIRPHRWVALSWLRGILNPLSDKALERDADMVAVVRELDGRTESKTTA
jgi:NAD(P)-dependent dehydrogenase (short-subunit alcohol dehydrogenase family)